MDAFAWMWVVLALVLLVTVLAAAVWAIQGLVRRYWARRDEAGADLGVWEDPNPRAPITAEQYRARITHCRAWDNVAGPDNGSGSPPRAGKR